MSPSPRHPIARRVVLVLVFAWVFLGGIAHFAATDLEMRIVPPWIPAPRFVVLATGVLELAGAAAIAWRATRRAGGIALFLLTIAVTPANVYMLQRPELFGVPVWLLVARLPLQRVLVAAIAWSTWPGAARAA